MSLPRNNIVPAKKVIQVLIHDAILKNRGIIVG